MKILTLNMRLKQTRKKNVGLIRFRAEETKEHNQTS